MHAAAARELALAESHAVASALLLLYYTTLTNAPAFVISDSGVCAAVCARVTAVQWAACNVQQSRSRLDPGSFHNAQLQGEAEAESAPNKLQFRPHNSLKTIRKLQIGQRCGVKATGMHQTQQRMVGHNIFPIGRLRHHKPELLQCDVSTRFR